MLKKIAGRVVSVAALGAPLASYAGGPDLSTISGAVDFGTVTTALLAVGAAIIVVYLAWKGAKLVIHAVKGA